jgi:D-alanine-D-alanine ligase-like ATP-grasp enzyme
MFNSALLCVSCSTSLQTLQVVDVGDDLSGCSTAQCFVSHDEFLSHLRDSADIVWPVLHGQFGEDGGIQVHLDKLMIT